MTDIPNPPNTDPTDPVGPSEPMADRPVGDTPPTPGPPPPPPGPRRLVRDPYTRLGGVASGIGHHYGIDVSIVRIVFVLLAVGTGFGLLAYLLAWLIIPRADHWPPGGAVSRPFQSMSKRDVGIGLAAVGVLLILAFGGGTTGSVLVPLVLVGGGVWLLLQPASPTAPAAGEMAFAGGTGSPGGPAGPVGPPPAAPVIQPPGPPVPPRSRRRRGWIAAALIAVFAFFVVLPLALLTALGIAIANGDFFDEPVTYVIDDVDELPLFVEADGGEVTVDLTDLDPAEFDAVDLPATVDVDLGAGSVRVLVPDELDVSVDANAGLGDINVFGTDDSGPASDVRVTNPDPDVEINIDLGVGEIDVVRR
ncbi:MAG: PspC domain-containing protein [Actinomycetota bacterium]